MTTLLVYLALLGQPDVCTGQHVSAGIVALDAPCAAGSSLYVRYGWGESEEPITVHANPGMYVATE